MLTRWASVVVTVAVVLVAALPAAHASSSPLPLPVLPGVPKIGWQATYANAVNVVCNKSSALLANLLDTACSAIFFNQTTSTTEVIGGSHGSLSSLDNRLGAEDQVGRTVLTRTYDRLIGGAGSGTAASADLPGALRGFSFFGVSDYESFDKHPTVIEPGFDRESVGLTVGGDYSFAGSALVGLAVNYTHARGVFDIGGGGFDIDTYRLLLYGGVLPMKNLFVDGYVGYGRKDFATDRRINLNVGGVAMTGQALGTANGDELKAGLNAGYDFVIRNLTVGPRVGLNYRESVVDSYRERGGTGFEVTYQRQSQDSLTTVVGLFTSMALSTGFGVVVPQVTAEWVHEFENNQKFHEFYFNQDLSRQKFRFVNDAPDRDYFNVGAGVSAVLPGGLSPFVNYREMLGYSRQHNHVASAGVRFSF